MTDIIQAKVLLVTPWNFSQFPDYMRGWKAYVEGVQTIFNDPNEPTGDIVKLYQGRIVAQIQR